MKLYPTKQVAGPCLPLPPSASLRGKPGMRAESSLRASLFLWLLEEGVAFSSWKPWELCWLAPRGLTAAWKQQRDRPEKAAQELDDESGPGRGLPGALAPHAGPPLPPSVPAGCWLPSAPSSLRLGTRTLSRSPSHVEVLD